MKKLWPSLSAAAVALAGAVLWLQMRKFWPDYEPVVWAAIVQAIFSILAIGASGWFAVWAPLYAEKQRFRASQARRVLASLTILQEIGAIAIGAARSAHARKFDERIAAHLSTQVRAACLELESVAGPEFPATMRVHVIKCRALTDLLDLHIKAALEQIAQAGALAGDHFDAVVDYAAKAETDLTEAISQHPIGKVRMPGFI
ncbi:MAG: hypothetical protein K2X07_09080 [Caulobacteraceae bacterium]|nr:hypothetical protein [Caulobacteraceae bacterium]